MLYVIFCLNRVCCPTSFASGTQLCESNCSNISSAYNATQWCITMQLSEIGFVLILFPFQHLNACLT
jgi:hypothetical protein